MTQIGEGMSRRDRKSLKVEGVPRHRIDTGNDETPDEQREEQAFDAGPGTSSAPQMSHRVSTILFLSLAAVGVRLASSGKITRAWSALWGSAPKKVQ